MRKSFLLFFFILCCLILRAKAQDLTPLQLNWTRIESVNKDFSINLPKDYIVFFDKEGIVYQDRHNWRDKYEFKNLRSMTAYQNGVSMWMESYDVKDAKRGLDSLLNQYDFEKYTVTGFSFENFSGLKLEPKTESSLLTFYFANKSRVYLISYGARDNKNAIIARFLTSIRLNGKPLFTSQNVKNDEPASISTLEDLQTTSIDISYKDENKKTENNQSLKASENSLSAPRAVNQNTQNNSASTAALSFPVSRDNAKDVIILWKPRPQYTMSARQAQTVGIVRLRITFSDNGQIKKIDVVKSLSNGLTESAVKAARRIRFLPAEKDDKPITVTKQLEYSFSIY